ncbi:MAG: hypothetical protein P1U70_06650 [Saprospiraceae bacterium]|jgi:hypothetical protein|nr:hypothetical protein [Saprospiraceae bacterium]
MKSFISTHVFRLVQLSSICVFAGRAWQHFNFDAPYRSFLWDETIMSFWVRLFTDLTWKEYVTSPEVDENIQLLIIISGWLYVACLLISIWIKKLPKPFHYILLIGALNLIILAFLYSKEKFFHFGQFFEYVLQFGSPILLYLIVNQLITTNRLIKLMKIGIGVTFSCHGLYAIGYYPRPESFIAMTTNILGLNNENAILFLKVAAILDFLITISQFFNKKIVIPFLAYAALWGLATSLARVWSNFYADFWIESLHQWTHETILRFPHFLIPLALILLLKNNQIAKI